MARPREPRDPEKKESRTTPPSQRLSLRFFRESNKIGRAYPVESLVYYFERFTAFNIRKGRTWHEFVTLNIFVPFLRAILSIEQ